MPDPGGAERSAPAHPRRVAAAYGVANLALEEYQTLRYRVQDLFQIFHLILAFLSGMSKLEILTQLFCQVMAKYTPVGLTNLDRYIS